MHTLFWARVFVEASILSLGMTAGLYLLGVDFSTLKAWQSIIPPLIIWTSTDIAKHVGKWYE